MWMRCDRRQVRGKNDAVGAPKSHGKCLADPAVSGSLTAPGNRVRTNRVGAACRLRQEVPVADYRRCRVSVVVVAERFRLPGNRFKCCSFAPCSTRTSRLSDNGTCRADHSCLNKRAVNYSREEAVNAQHETEWSVLCLVTSIAGASMSPR